MKLIVEMQIFLEVLIRLFWLIESFQRTVAPMRTFWQVELNLLVHSSMQLFCRWLEPSSHELYSWEKQLFPENIISFWAFSFNFINVNSKLMLKRCNKSSYIHHLPLLDKKEVLSHSQPKTLDRQGTMHKQLT